jgi:transposase
MLPAFGIEISTGTLDNFRISGANRLTGFFETMCQSSIDSSAGFFDETGMKVSALGHWVHVAATALFSLFLLDRKRGREAHDKVGVLRFFRGVLHRDDYHSYRDIYGQAVHALCNAHLIRDLKYAIERDGQKEWAQPLMKLLLKIKTQVDNSPTGILDVRWQGRHRKEYDRLVALGLSKNPLQVNDKGKTKGKKAQTKTCNLLLRFRDKSNAILRFMTHANAAFTNNQAERDLRMNKVRQKVSGGFRSLKAGKEFMTIRSFVATAVKRGADPVEELVKVFTPNDESYMWLARYPE